MREFFYSIGIETWQDGVKWVGSAILMAGVILGMFFAMVVVSEFAGWLP